MVIKSWNAISIGLGMKACHGETIYSTIPTELTGLVISTVGLTMKQSVPKLATRGHLMVTLGVLTLMIQNKEL
jgi:hypothetical protein